MVTEARTPLPFRVSDAERERALDALDRSMLAGRMSADTFERRVARALAARSQAQLSDLLSDLPSRRRPRLVPSLVSRFSALVAEVEAAWREPRVPKIALPSNRRSIAIGRAPDCDLVLTHETASRHHASLRRVGETWRLADLNSTNGTRLNGLRLIDEVEVQSGDRVSFGGARYRITQS